MTHDRSSCFGVSVAGSLDGTCRVGSGRDASCLVVRNFDFRGAVFRDRCSLGLCFGGLRRPLDGLSVLCFGDAHLCFHGCLGNTGKRMARFFAGDLSRLAHSFVQFRAKTSRRSVLGRFSGSRGSCKRSSGAFGIRTRRYASLHVAYGNNQFFSDSFHPDVGPFVAAFHMFPSI